MTVTDDQDRAPGGPALTELPEDITIATEEGRRLAEQLQDRRRHARKLLEVKNLSTHFFTSFILITSRFGPTTFLGVTNCVAGFLAIAPSDRASEKI